MEGSYQCTPAVPVPISRSISNYMSEDPVESYEKLFPMGCPAAYQSVYPIAPSSNSSFPLPDPVQINEPFSPSQSSTSPASTEAGNFEFEYEGDIFLANMPATLASSEEEGSDTASVDSDIVLFMSEAELY